MGMTTFSSLATSLIAMRELAHGPKIECEDVHHSISGVLGSLWLLCTIITTCTTPTGYSPLHYDQYASYTMTNMASTMPQVDRKTARNTRTRTVGWAIVPFLKNVSLLFKNYSTHNWPIHQPPNPENEHIFLLFGIPTFSGCHNYSYNPTLCLPPLLPLLKWVFMFVSGFWLPESACHHHLPIPKVSFCLLLGFWLAATAIPTLPAPLHYLPNSKMSTNGHFGVLSVLCGVSTIIPFILKQVQMLISGVLFLPPSNLKAK